MSLFVSYFLFASFFSDYQKIKVHARAVAEEIGSAFDYKEVPIDIACPEELNLIDLAIDGEERSECEEDWTSKLGINLRYCVKARKNSSSKQVPYKLALGMLFSDKGPGSEFLSINWQSRRYRSRRLKYLARAKACDDIQRKKDDQLEGKGDVPVVKKMLQYSRRKFRSKKGSNMVHEPDKECTAVSAVLHRDFCDQVSEDELDTGNSRGDPDISHASASVRLPQMQSQNQVTETATSMTLKASSQFSNFSLDPSLMEEHAGLEVHNQTTKKLEVDGKTNLRNLNHSEMPYETSSSELCIKDNQIYHDQRSSSLTVVTGEKIETPSRNPNTKAINCDNKGNNFDLDEVHQELQSTHENNKVEAASSPVSLVTQHILTSMEEISESARKNNCTEGISDGASLKETTELKIVSLNVSSKEPSLSCDELGNEQTVNVEVFEAQREQNAVAVDIEVQQETQIALGSEKEINHSTDISVKQCEPPRGEHSEVIDNEVILDSEKQCLIQNKNQINEAAALSHVAVGEHKSLTVSSSEVSVETCPNGDCSTQFISDGKMESEIQPKGMNDMEICSDTETTSKDASVTIRECFTNEGETCARDDLSGSEVHFSQDNRELESCELTTPNLKYTRKKRNRELEQITKDNTSCYGFVRSPCEGLRPRTANVALGRSRIETGNTEEEDVEVKRARKRSSDVAVPCKNKKDVVKKIHRCDLDGCNMRFATKAELMLHKRNRCPHEGCGKKFSSHKYALLHQRVHDDERPLKCPWEGCSMSFKWAWARTEHIRVHTGEKPYKCKVEGCGLSFRFVSDFSRHRRKTGHYVKSHE